MAAGHPTHYKPKYCELAIKCGKEGQSIAEIGLACGVAKQTIYNWMKEHPKFLDAIREAVSYAQAWYERSGREGMTADKFNSALWNKQVSCRFRDDYSESSTVYNKNMDVATDKVPESKVEEIAREIAESLKGEF